MMYKLLSIALCFTLIIDASQESEIKISPKAVNESRTSPTFAPSPTHSQKEIAALEKDAVKYWREAVAGATSAKRSFETINLNVKGDLERSIEIIDKAIDVAEQAADLADISAQESGTSEAARAALLAAKEVENARGWQIKALNLQLKIKEQTAISQKR